VISVEYGAEDFLGMLPHAGKLFGIGPGDPSGSVAQPVAVGILADGDQDLAHRTLDAAEVHVLAGTEGTRWQTAGGIRRRIRERVCGAVLGRHPSSLLGTSSWLLPGWPAGGTDCPFAPALRPLAESRLASVAAVSASSFWVSTGGRSEGTRLPYPV